MALERVAVVGAGLAGLSAALRLKEAGVKVELFERSRLLGGRATSFEIDGIEVDNGQHVFLACCTEFIAFAREVGMEDALRLQERFDAHILSRDGRSGRLRASGLPAPFHLAPSFATYRHLTLREKLRVTNVILSAPRVATPTGDTLNLSRGDHAETFETWLTVRKQGAGERRAFWDPFFIPALNAPFDRVTAEDALFVLRTAFLSDAGAARFGFSTVPLAHLAAAAAQKLDAVNTSTGVLAIEPGSPSVTSGSPSVTSGSPSVTSGSPSVTLSLSKGDNATYDGVVLAVPPRALANILGDPQRYSVENLDAYEAYPIIDVHVWHDAGSIGLDFAAALDSPLQWIFEKAPGYLACSFSAADDYLRRPTAELEALAWREVQAFLPALASAKLVRSAVTRNPEATWLPRAGARRTSQRTSHPAVAVAGAWTETGWPDTMESAVRSGTLAATHLLRASREGIRNKSAMSPA